MSRNEQKLAIAAGLLAILVFCCGVLGVAAVLVGRTGASLARNLANLSNVLAETTFQQTFRVGVPATLKVDVKVGRIEVVAAEGDVIDIQARLKAYGRDHRQAQQVLQQMQVRAQQSGSAVTFTADWQEPPRGWRGKSPRAEVRIVVPRQTRVTLRVSVGEVLLQGTEGDVEVESDVGRVTISNVRVPEHLSVRTDVAAIELASALSPGATYELRSDVGSIAVRVPEDSRFAIDASSDVGRVAVNFDVVGEESHDFVGRRVQGVVGGDDSTRLIIRSNVGAISVRRR